MTNCHIHFGPLNEIRQRCVESQIKYCGLHKLVIDDGNVEGYIREMMDDLGIKERPRRFDLTHPKGRVVVSDWLRFWLCTWIPSLNFMCSDLEILKPIDFDFDPRFPYAAGFSNGGIDYCWTICNGQGERFEDYLKKQIIDDRIDVFQNIGIADIGFKPIPPEYHRHHSIDMIYEPDKWQAFRFW